MVDPEPLVSDAPRPPIDHSASEPDLNSSGSSNGRTVPRAEEHSEPPATEAPSEPEEESGKEKAESSPSEALLAALGRFIQEKNAAQPAAEKRLPYGLMQLVTLLLVISDIVLAYSFVPPSLVEGRLVKFISTLVPWLLGASLLAYFDHVREWFLTHCGNRSLTWVAALFFIVLLLPQFPIFSIQVVRSPDNADVKPADSKVGMEVIDNKTFLLFPGLNSYDVVCETQNVGNAESFRMSLGRWRILSATVAQLPFLNSLLGSRVLQLTPLYSVGVRTSSGPPIIEIRGQFSPEYLASSGHRVTVRAGHPTIEVTVGSAVQDWISLPPGIYEFTANQHDCQKTFPQVTVGPKTEPETLDFDKRPCLGAPPK